tara:strand:- start:1012 stop:1848 length:837 start_codon:yes stop_codon:yes gene_type:complete
MVSLENQIIYVFNKFTKSFIKEIKKQNEDVKSILKKNYLCFDKNTDEYINDFIMVVSDDKIKELFNKGNIKDNEDIDNIEILKELKAGEINGDIKVYYLYIFYLLSKLYTDTNNCGDDSKMKSSYKAILVSILKILNGGYSTQDIVDEVFDDDYRMLMSYVADNRIEEGSEPIDAPFNMGMINDTKIGKLAQEISTQIDMSTLNTDNISNMNDLFSGENNAMGSIIQQVSSVMSEKMQSGELKQEELMTEAFAMMGNMQNNDMMNNMMNMMKNTDLNK